MLFFGIPGTMLRQEMLNICKMLMIVKSWMVFTSAFCVLAVRHRVLLTGGTVISILDQLSSCRLEIAFISSESYFMPILITGLSLDNRLSRWGHRWTTQQAEGLVQCLSLSHNHELHEDVSQGIFFKTYQLIVFTQIFPNPYRVSTPERLLPSSNVCCLVCAKRMHRNWTPTHCIRSRKPIPIHFSRLTHKHTHIYTQPMFAYP